MSNWTRSALPALPNPRLSWPTEFALSDQDAGDFAIIQPSKRLSDTQEKAFTEHYHNAILCGSSLELQNWATKANMHTEIKHETDPCAEAKIPLSNAFLSDVCEDYLPQIGLYSTDLIAGSKHYRFRSESAETKQLCGAVCSTLPLLKNGQSALSKLFEQRPKSPKQIHVSLCSHRKTPASIWQRTNTEIRSLLPLAAQYLPSKNSTIKTETTHSFLIAKLICLGENTWQTVLEHPIVYSMEDVKLVYERLLIEWIRYLRHSPTLHWEDLLRDRADLIYRNLHHLKI